MKIEIVKNNIILINPSSETFEIHPLWLRERAKTESLVDKFNDQRLYDPSQLDQNLKNDLQSDALTILENFPTLIKRPFWEINSKASKQLEPGFLDDQQKYLEKLKK